MRHRKPGITALVLAVLLTGSGCGEVAKDVAPAPSPAHSSTAATRPPESSVTGKPGTLVLNPASGRQEKIILGIASTAVLIGDSQAGGAAGVSGKNTWVQRGITDQGYKVYFAGAGGTGFVARSPKIPNYPNAIAEEKVILPFGNPALVVIQGGGNDASQGASDAQITKNAGKLITELKASYPHSKFLMIGTLAKGPKTGGGRRSAVDAVLAAFAKSEGITFISTGDWITKYSLENKMADRVHLKIAGHEVLEEVLAKKMNALGLKN